MVLLLLLPFCVFGALNSSEVLLDTDDWIIRNGHERADNLDCLQERISPNMSLKTRFSLVSKYVAELEYEKGNMRHGLAQRKILFLLSHACFTVANVISQRVCVPGRVPDGERVSGAGVAFSRCGASPG